MEKRPHMIIFILWLSWPWPKPSFVIWQARQGDFLSSTGFFFTLWRHTGRAWHGHCLGARTGARFHLRS
jgi:hypothetical protein